MQRMKTYTYLKRATREANWRTIKAKHQHQQQHQLLDAGNTTGPGNINTNTASSNSGSSADGQSQSSGSSSPVVMFQTSYVQPDSSTPPDATTDDAPMLDHNVQPPDAPMSQLTIE